MRFRLLHVLSITFGVILCILSFAVIYQEVKDFRVHDLFAGLAEIAPLSLLAAVNCVVADYVVLTGYDSIALAQAGVHLPYRKIALASFLGHAFTINIDLLTGSSIRYRIYRMFGLTVLQVATVVFVANATYLCGFLVLSGLLFTFDPPAALAEVHLPFSSLEVLGLVSLSLIFLYIFLSFTWRRLLKIGRWELHIPTPKRAVAQLLLSSLDWLLSATALYLLLPSIPGLPFTTYLGAFLLAQFLGQLSQAPAGLGIFEAVMIVLLTPVASPSLLLGPLLVFRVVYYLLPFFVAAVLLGLTELHSRRRAALAL